MASKIKIKIGEIELEYDGSDEFLKEELPILLKTMFDLYGNKPRSDRQIPKDGNGKDPGAGSNGEKKTTSGFAQKLKVKKGPDLVMAASFALTSGGKASFTGAELRTEMKNAKAFVKESYLTNIDRSLKALVKLGRLNDVGPNQYSLPQSEIDTHLSSE